MKTYFVSLLSSRLPLLADTLKDLGIVAKHTDDQAGFTIIEIECSEGQAHKIWDMGFNVSEQ